MSTSLTRLPAVPSQLAGIPENCTLILAEGLRALSMELKEQRQEVKKELKEQRQEVKQELKEQRQLLLSQQRPATYDSTFAALGDATMIAMEQLGKVREFEGDKAAGEAVLNTEQLELLAACTSETELVKLITPTLWRLRISSALNEDACLPVLVNSENFAWLDRLDAPLRPEMRLKPDLFVAPRVCLEEHEGTDRQGSGDCYVFGRLADRHLQLDGCVREVYEAKLGTLTLAHFGELVMYHRFIPGECRGMLFNGSCFWLFSSYVPPRGGHIQYLKLVKSKWALPGTAGLVRRFFGDDAPPPPPLLPVLQQLLSTLDLFPAPGDAPFLGGGGSGRVFAVQSHSKVATTTSRQPRRMALKVVLATSPHWWIVFSSEFEAMRTAAARGAPVVPVVADSLNLVGCDGGGYLLARCGTRFDATGSLTACTAAFTALAALHSLSIVHGDARLPNLLLLDRKAVWVDLSSIMLDSAADPSTLAAFFQVDAEMLAKSVLRHANGPDSPLPGSVTAALARYDCSSRERVDALAYAVWAAFQEP